MDSGEGLFTFSFKSASLTGRAKAGERVGGAVSDIVLFGFWLHVWESRIVGSISQVELH